MSDNNKVIKFQKRKTHVVSAVIVVTITIALVVLFTCFKINEIQVTGNKHYSKEQIIGYVKDDGYIDNTILLMLKNKINPVSDIPFIAKIGIDYAGAHKITVTVYEKAIAGCIEYMDRYVYFDQDGYVLEISLKKLSDSPCVTGMNFESVELHGKLPIKDKKRFKQILKLTQLISKYNLKIDSIQFTSEDEIVLYHENIRIELGDGSKIEEQLIDLNQILDGLAGKNGTLNMKDIDNAVGTASFKAKK